jgi:hypothetical protein
MTTATIDRPRDTQLVPVGNYAVPNWTERRVYFFSVERPDHGKYAGRTFLVRLHGDNRENVNGLEKAQIMRAIADDPMRAAALYGKRIGKCPAPGCGATLTDPKSIARGIGPVCAKRYA